MTRSKFPSAVLRETMVRDNIPVLLYDKSAIRKNFRYYRQVTDQVGATFSFAVKAFSHSEVFEIASEFVDGFDISNLNEWEKVKPHFKPGQIVWFTNGKYDRELDQLIKEVNQDFLRVIVNDLEDFKIIKNKKVKYLIRLCSSSLIEQPKDSRFGIKMNELLNLKEDLLDDPLFQGFHIHQGVEDNNFEILKLLQSELKKVLTPFQGQNFTINFGGGFHHFSREELLVALNYFKDSFKIHIEPGRAFISHAGHALAAVDKYIHSDKTLRIFTPLSFSAHLKWSAPSLAGIINLAAEEKSLVVDEIIIEGPTCYEYDRIRGFDVKEPVRISEKSFIVLSNISGYSREWNTSFNGIDLIDVKFFSSNDDHLLK